MFFRSNRGPAIIEIALSQAFRRKHGRLKRKRGAPLVPSRRSAGLHHLDIFDRTAGPKGQGTVSPILGDSSGAGARRHSFTNFRRQQWGRCQGA